MKACEVKLLIGGLASDVKCGQPSVPTATEPPWPCEKHAAGLRAMGWKL